ncbi:hypothetical protein [Shewanella sp. UCD-KL12]|uniref:hypothetical protein n=1 Tax=Shewanella sp. UCD-KL12 TaxID=1917163 RepID=UPI0009709636|nr:hypothetical protein [Shewanella sp. UCD-KL12]
MPKPDVSTAMVLLITKIRATIPFHLDEAQMCQGRCLGCSKKMLEMLDTELGYWESSQEKPGLVDLGELTTLSKRTHKILERNKLI